MKTIKTIEMTRQIRDASYKMTKDMTKKELIKYFQQKSDLLNPDTFKILKERRKNSIEPHTKSFQRDTTTPSASLRK